MKFRYTVIDPDGRRQKGQLEADNAEAARDQLLDSNFRILELRAVRSLLPPEVDSGPALTLRQRALFSDQLQVMVNAGIPLERSLEALSSSLDLAAAEVASTLREKIQHGSSLSEAMAGLPAAFDHVYLQLVKVAETTGQLHEVLKVLARRLLREAERRSQLASALAYPSFILLFAVAMVMLLVYWMMPPFLEVFQQLHLELPWITRFLMQVSQNYWVPTLLLLLLFAPLLMWLFADRHPSLARALDLFKQHAPVAGEFTQHTVLARTCRGLAMMVRAGVSLQQALRVVQKPTSGLLSLDRALAQIEAAVRDGCTLSESMNSHPTFPVDLVKLVAVGEEAGAVDRPLEQWASMTDERLDYRLRAMLDLVEPALLLFLGAAVTVVLLAVFTPMFTLVSSL